jgi:hypothetical protein
MAVSKMYVKRMLAECNQITINITHHHMKGTLQDIKT